MPNPPYGAFFKRCGFAATVTAAALLVTGFPEDTSAQQKAEPRSGNAQKKYKGSIPLQEIFKDATTEPVRCAKEEDGCGVVDGRCTNGKKADPCYWLREPQ